MAGLLLPRPARATSGLRRALALCACVLALSVPAALAPARAQALSDAQLRVRFLLNFLRFTEWPAATLHGAGAPLTLCVLGSADPFGGALAELRDATAAARRIELRPGIGADQAGECQLLYVPDAELRRMAGAREAIGRLPVLVVGESEAVLDRGGMIGLRSVDRRLAFVVALEPARRASLTFAPQMLHAAAEVLP
jgi:hypothetical protein